ncbi:uncharacterized protein LOC109862827 isoform X4 [Pseudomyrmex gracilis]|uniref:uncharacterized protein LOC109862827 isoform X4 n=1 Tax=Pseudomyrmex gracilis TaxID=219809 RepID=UPI0009953EEC|nr:uncharacterized protein LOC109862827 isoform X4 [Pseudomyrmex gracilis]
MVMEVFRFLQIYVWLYGADTDVDVADKESSSKVARIKMESIMDLCDTMQTQDNRVVYDSSADKEFSVENVTTMHPVQEESNRVVYNSSNDTIIDMEPDCASAGTSKPLKYPAQITEENILTMSPKSIVQCVRILKDTCEKKTRAIKRLQKHQHRQKKKIESLQALLSELSKCELLSSNASEMDHIP